MAIVTSSPAILTELEQSKMGSVLVSAAIRNNNPDSSIKGFYIVLCKGNEAEIKRTEFSVFEDKRKSSEVADRWRGLRNNLSLFPGQEITPNIWEYAVKQLDYSKEIPVIPCPIITTPDGSLLTLIRKLDKTKELGEACKENLMKMHKLIAEQSLLDPEDQITTKLKAAYGGAAPAQKVG